jgi:hypothetical protein
MVELDLAELARSKKGTRIIPVSSLTPFLSSSWHNRSGLSLPRQYCVAGPGSYPLELSSGIQRTEKFGDGA